MKTTFKIKSRSNFTDFLKRFHTIDQTMVLEVRPDVLLCKSGSGDRSVIKSSRLAMQDVLEGDVKVDNIRVYMYDIGRIIGLFKHFKPADEVFIDMDHENVSGEEMAKLLTFRTSSTKIKVECGDPVLFKYIADEMLKKVVKKAADNKKVEFPFPKDIFSIVTGLCTLDDKADPITITVKDGQVTFKGKSYEQRIEDIPSVPETDFIMLTEHFKMIEPETSTFVLCDHSMLVKSQESQTIIILGRVEPNSIQK